MEFRGIFEDGMIRPTEPLDLPDGTEVEFHPVHDRSGTRKPAEDLDRLSDQFRHRHTIDELADQQGVKPVSSIDELAVVWPDNDPADSVDELIRSLREWRK